jgi:hypothetical protein
MNGDDDDSTADLRGAPSIGSGHNAFEQNRPFDVRTISDTSSQFMDGSSIFVK